MTTNRIGGRIDALEERLKKLKAKKQRMEARTRSIESRRARRDDTRRKILVGAIVQAKVDQGVLDKEVLMGWLESALTREDDRALFGLAVGASAGLRDTEGEGQAAVE